MDPSRIFSLVDAEKRRQESVINLIASENQAPEEVLRATGSVLTNKYAEGYPSKRYYGGCDIVDQVDQVDIVAFANIEGAGKDMEVTVDSCNHNDTERLA